MIGMTIEEITPFVRKTIGQMRVLNKALDINGVSFELVVQGNKIRFSVLLKKEA